MLYDLMTKERSQLLRFSWYPLAPLISKVPSLVCLIAAYPATFHKV